MSDKYGIDVSEHNGNCINFDNQDIKFCIIRCGYGSRDTQSDKKWAYNLEQCRSHNIPMGMYLYSYATGNDGAIAEADMVYRMLTNAKAQGYSFPYGIWYDVEDKSQKLPKQVVTNFILTFINHLKNDLKVTEDVGLYTYKSFMANYVDRSRITCKLWMASYVYSDGKYHGKDSGMNYDYDIYQYTSTNTDKSWCTSSGLDQNMCYTDFGGGNVEPVDPDADKKKQIDDLTKQKTDLETQIQTLKTAIDSASDILSKVI